jgi:hypothetical protein
MKKEHTSQVAGSAGPPSASLSQPRKGRSIQTVGVLSFTALGLLLGGAAGGAVEGDLVGVLHVGVPAALVAFAFARALLSRPGSW